MEFSKEIQEAYLHVMKAKTLGDITLVRYHVNGYSREEAAAAAPKEEGSDLYNELLERNADFIIIALKAIDPTKIR
jgi:hypothetical protein